MTKQTALVVLAISLVAVIASQLLFKLRLGLLLGDAAAHRSLLETAGHAIRDPILWIGGLLVLVGAACWYLAMARLPLSFMLPVAGLIAPVASVLSHFLLGESLTSAKIAAILVIAAGVTWLGWLGT